MAISEIDAAIQVAQARALGPRRAARLLAECGSFREVHAADADRFSSILGCSASVSRRIVRSIRSASSRSHRRAACDVGAEAISLSDPRYPTLLREVCDPPTVLWVRGEVSLLSSPAVAVVGSRLCSVSAPEVVGKFVGELGAVGCTIVSGGARGVDAAAHRGALCCSVPTIAVLGSGLDQPYPPEHAGLYEEIVSAGGAIVSEYVCGVTPRPGYFPARNRIVAGMSLGVLVHEAGARSGAMITARLAADDYGREVMVIPGSVVDGRSEGSHRAVREGWAVLVDRPEHALEQLLEAQGLLLALAGGVEMRIELKLEASAADVRNESVL